MYAITVPINVNRQINTILSLSLFPELVQNAKNFQQYQVNKIKFSILPRYNFSSAPGALPLMIRVPLYNDQVPLPTIQSYMKFKNLTMSIPTSQVTHTFTPVVLLSQQNGVFERSPKLSCKNVDTLHYGYSTIVDASTVSAYTLYYMIQMTVSFFTYDGGSNVALKIYDLTSQQQQYS